MHYYGSENNLRLANNKADDLTIKKLTQRQPDYDCQVQGIGIRYG